MKDLTSQEEAECNGMFTVTSYFTKYKENDFEIVFLETLLRKYNCKKYHH